MEQVGTTKSLVAIPQLSVRYEFPSRSFQPTRKAHYLMSSAVSFSNVL
jgi:hypothetical protein